MNAGGARWPYPRIVAHRGGGALAPENTLAAIRLGASMGFRGVEFDVMLAGDAMPVLIHDETLERTTGTKGNVAHTAYAELAKLDAGAWKGPKWRGERIPTFAAAARLCRELDLWANVEIKPAKGHERATGDAVARAAREVWRGTALAPVLSSFSLEALEAARAAAPELPRGYLVGEIPADWREKMRALECVALHCHHRGLTSELAAQIHAAGHALLCWTVNVPADARRLLGWGVDCLVTDALDAIGPEFS
jgi:glycerophosphoryl diester phosphodiesterase